MCDNENILEFEYWVLLNKQQDDQSTQEVSRCPHQIQGLHVW